MYRPFTRRYTHLVPNGLSEAMLRTETSCCIFLRQFRNPSPGGISTTWAPIICTREHRSSLVYKLAASSSRTFFRIAVGPSYLFLCFTYHTLDWVASHGKLRTQVVSQKKRTCSRPQWMCHIFAVSQKENTVFKAPVNVSFIGLKPNTNPLPPRTQERCKILPSVVLICQQDSTRRLQYRRFCVANLLILTFNFRFTTF